MFKWFGRLMDKYFGSAAQDLTVRQKMLRVIGNRLFCFLALAVALVVWWLIETDNSQQSSMLIVFFTGVVGGIVGLQNRLKNFTDEDLLLLNKSVMYLLLAPLVGGFMAMLLKVLFISGLLDGQMFPTFVSNSGDAGTAEKGIGVLFEVRAESYQDYGKLVFWSFVAGFSERFVTRIISRFESGSVEPEQNNRLDDTPT